MNDPFHLLGLPGDADERAIKAAYAKRLRTARPDEDPVGFQHLTEAYHLALAMRKAVASRNGMPISGQHRTGLAPLAASSSAPPGPSPPDAGSAGQPAPPRRSPPVRDPGAAADADAPAHPVLNATTFFNAYREHAGAADAASLTAWLDGEPALWHLPTKFAAGRALLRALHDAPIPMPEDCFKATLRFFNLDDAVSGADAVFLQRLHRRCVAEWEILPQNLDTLSWRAFGSTNRENLRRLDRLCRHCTRPFRQSGALLASLRPGHAQQVAHLLLALCGGNVDDLPRSFDRRRARFWLDTARRDFNRTRLMVFGFRSAVALTLIPLAAMLVAIGASGGTADGIAIRGALGVSSTMTVSIVLAAWLWIGVAWTCRKLGELVRYSRAWRALRIGFVPAMCLGGLAIAVGADVAMGTFATVTAMLAAFVRYRARHGSRLSAGAGIGLIMLVIFVSNVATSVLNASGRLELLPPLLTAGIALALWALDMRKTRWHRAAHGA